MQGHACLHKETTYKEITIYGKQLPFIKQSGLIKVLLDSDDMKDFKRSRKMSRDNQAKMLLHVEVEQNKNALFDNAIFGTFINRFSNK